MNLYDREGEIDPAMLTAMLQDAELAGIVARLALTRGDKANWERTLQDCLDRLEARKHRSQTQRLKEQASSADPQALAA